MLNFKVDRLKDTRINSLKIKRKKYLEACMLLKHIEKKSRNRKSIKYYGEQLTDAHNFQKVKTIIGFNRDGCSSIKSLSNFKCYWCLILTNNDSASVQRLFICKVDRVLTEGQSR